ncbi:MAG: lipoyl synthase [Methyloprofundus sp.]|nr:lipoyl synthase [Methyloprofundus sp.]
MSSTQAPSRTSPETHQRNADKLSRIPIKVEPAETVLRKPEWIRVKLSTNPDVARIKKTLRDNKLHSVCEEAACPNLSECFSLGTATFMIMGDLCTRRCPFCDVAHGKPKALDADEPVNMAKTIKKLALNYVVITSVNRDDLRDGGAGHFAACINEIRKQSSKTKIEVLVPDFRGRVDIALDILKESPVDVFNHNLETIPRLYKQARPGAHYQESLDLLKAHYAILPKVPTKSGLMLGIGETQEEVLEVMRDLRAHHCSILTLGQYLQPSKDHLAVQRYITPDEFDEYAILAKEMGFKKVASGPMVRSSYHADEQAQGLLEK